MTVDNPDIDEIHTIFAGKFRRYHGESWLRRLFDVRTNLLNVRDLLYFFIGTIQSLMLLRRVMPDAVLLKGGFVGVPVGFSCVFWRLAFVTHDSDALPGLANRLVSRWARYHATALPADYYSYPVASVKHVGVLVSREHAAVTTQQQAIFKQQIRLPKQCKLLLITGGSGGAASINMAIRKTVEQLLESNNDLYVIHQTGRGKSTIYDAFSHPRLRVEELLFPLHEFTGASDLVVARAGANTLAELGVQGRACIVVPNPYLTGGHQLKNAQYFESRGAIRVVNDTTIKKNPQVLADAVNELLANDAERNQLAARLQQLVPADATHKLTVLLLKVAKGE